MSPNTTRRTRRLLALALFVVVAAPIAAGAGHAATADTADAPTVSVTDVDVASDGTATATVVLSSAPQGLAGFAVDVSVEGSAARITNASYPETYGLTSEPALSDDGRQVRLEAADLNERVQPGASDVVLGTVELTGVSAGSAELSAEPLQFDADGGGPVEPDTAVGTVTVTSGTPDDGSSSTQRTSAAVESPDADSASASGLPALQTIAGALVALVVVALLAVVAVRRRR
ncbi:hypothetical protein [Halarchaeum nitratireducens]|uniref:Cohesin domain-containing protein n=1 Tax=Halarchaeum nitratireducens TaxID=489913 RepID=A0A830GA60_9EURY|nr:MULTISPECIES: hypothetical protein [Halarchaeum]MBP2250404.1 hypothetical protein [Halarchaeum solikamskense]GGN13257.1 hypothetical protein GCM10009021_11820 [Halarchaeum nitratireducens]